MKTINCILRGELDRAVGDAGRIAAARVRNLPAREDNVVDLAAWKAEHLVEPEAGRESALGQYKGRELVRRRQRRSTAAQNLAELAATLAVTAAFVALIVRVLLF